MGFLRQMGPLEWVVLLVIVLLIVGPKKLPEMARGLGKGIRSFKSEVKGEDDSKEDKKGE